MTEQARTKYDGVAMTLHWVIAALMIFMIFFGEDLMGEGGEAGEAVAGTFLPSLHVSLGATILLLTLLRIVWRLMNPPPDLPASMLPWEVTMTKAVHGLFYLLMIGLPITGMMSYGHWLTENPAMSGIAIYGAIPVIQLPNLGLPSGLLHNVGSKLGMVLVILHVLAALKHQFINRDGLLARMSPH